MIYLILTASLTDLHEGSKSDIRIEQYKTSITKTLDYVPGSIQPIIVENNGLRKNKSGSFYSSG